MSRLIMGHTKYNYDGSHNFGSYRSTVTTWNTLSSSNGHLNQNIDVRLRYNFKLQANRQIEHKTLSHVST